MEGATLNLNVGRAVKVGKALIAAYKGDGIFGQGTEDMPELLTPLHLKRGSELHVNYLTLLVALDYMRDAEQLWESGTKAFADKGASWVFDVNSEKMKDLGALVQALRKHKVTKKWNKDAATWQKIALSIKQLFRGSMKWFVAQECSCDATKIFTEMKSKYRKSFPFLTGRKILPLWIRMLKDVCGLDIKNLDGIPLPVDVHTARATIFTGCLTAVKIKTSIPNIMGDVDAVWGEASAQIEGVSKLHFDEPLWTLSKYGCTKMRNQVCPRYRVCPVKEFCVAVKQKMQVVQKPKGVVLE